MYLPSLTVRVTLLPMPTPTPKQPTHYIFTRHARLRFVQRTIANDCTEEEARRMILWHSKQIDQKMREMLGVAVNFTAPPWKDRSHVHGEGATYLISGDTVFVVRKSTTTGQPLVITCFSRDDYFRSSKNKLRHITNRYSKKRPPRREHH